MRNTGSWCLACMAAVALGHPGAGGQPQPERQKLEDTPKLTVRGEAQLEKPADQLRLRLGVVSEAAEATEALNENSRRMSDVVAAIRKAGLDKAEYETGRFQIQPVHTRRPRAAGPDWRPQIIGYQVTNALSIKTKKLELAGELIEAANEVGANSINVIGFDLADPRQYRAEAIKAATANALADARALADAAGLELVRILSITLDEQRRQPLGGGFGGGRVMAAEAAIAPPIAAGDVTVRATVRIVYEIAEGRQ